METFIWGFVWKTFSRGSRPRGTTFVDSYVSFADVSVFEKGIKQVRIFVCTVYSNKRLELPPGASGQRIQYTAVNKSSSN